MMGKKEPGRKHKLSTAQVMGWLHGMGEETVLFWDPPAELLPKYHTGKTQQLPLASD